MNWTPILEFHKNNPNVPWAALEAAIKEAVKGSNIEMVAPAETTNEGLLGLPEVATTQMAEHGSSVLDYNISQADAAKVWNQMVTLHKSVAALRTSRQAQQPIATIAEVLRAAPADLSTVEAQYKDLLNHLGCAGHQGAVAEIALLRKKAGLSS